MSSKNHNIIILKVILFKCLSVRPEMVSYEGKLFLLLSKYLRKFRETQWIYLFHIYEFQHMVMFKILGKPLQNHSCLFQAFEIFL